MSEDPETSSRYVDEVRSFGHDEIEYLIEWMQSKASHASVIGISTEHLPSDYRIQAGYDGIRMCSGRYLIGPLGVSVTCVGVEGHAGDHLYGLTAPVLRALGAEAPSRASTALPRCPCNKRGDSGMLRCVLALGHAEEHDYEETNVNRSIQGRR